MGSCPNPDSTQVWARAAAALTSSQVMPPRLLLVGMWLEEQGCWDQMGAGSELDSATWQLCDVEQVA